MKIQQCTTLEVCGTELSADQALSEGSCPGGTIIRISILINIIYSKRSIWWMLKLKPSVVAFLRGKGGGL